MNFWSSSSGPNLGRMSDRFISQRVYSARAWRLGSYRHYSRLNAAGQPAPQSEGFWLERNRSLLKSLLVATLLAVLTYAVVAISKHVNSRPSSPSPSGLQPSLDPGGCSRPENGFQCNSSTSHWWGQYSPYFTVPSEIDSSVPEEECELTFAQVLSRHGARNPTAGKSAFYTDLIDRLHRTTTSYGPDPEFLFLKDYVYRLGADQLTPFGQQEMVDSGTKFYRRYRSLISSNGEQPFIRASDQDRVVMSARNFTQGYHAALVADGGSPHHGGDLPYKILTISESADANNTMHHGLCTAFESSVTGSAAQATFASTFTPRLISRLEPQLRGFTFVSSVDVIALMDLCAFETVNIDPSSIGRSKLSPFCNLFSENDWKYYDYYQTLGKWYGYGPGNELGPTQGVGYVNELIARMTGRPVDDKTSTNSTLDHSNGTFPLDRKVYADFSHDNDMTSILGALGLYGGVDKERVSNTSRVDVRDMDGFSAAWTVPFAGRVYFEKMRCQGREMDEELVRVLVNDRVVRLRGCEADEQGRCALDKWVESLDFARKGGLWDRCFV
ncbi:histidine phosphatase superfamily [Apodospora peruviana]|uniref:3-phytase n=1 Tax=Apodospora peruviana TaxID=516989 RepID=A0AAE0I686_9PEZI|nr:histidine phosphatase superfamily [Apodospora peruviana]